MITEEQQKWLDHLSGIDQVAIVPLDSTAEEKYGIAKKQIQSLLGEDFPVEHRGASSLKISGQDEIDIYVPVKGSVFNQVVKRMVELYGDPRSVYPLKRVRFVTSIQNKHVDVFIINKEDKSWIDSETFHEFLLTHPEKLDAYRKLKERLAGKSIKDYYTAKTEFINEVLSEAASLEE